MGFNPKEHIIKIGQKEYMPVNWRVVWFRDTFPQGHIDTEFLSVGEMIVAKTIVTDNEGNFLASGHATVRDASQREQTWAGRIIEKAETAAIGRALANAGFGTQFTDEDEGEYLADSPVDKGNQSSKPAPKSNPPTKTEKVPTWQEQINAVIRPLYDNAFHHENALESALKSKIVNKDDAPNIAAAAILLHRAQKDFGFGYEQICEVIGKKPEDLLQTPDAYYKVWQLLTKHNQENPM